MFAIWIMAVDVTVKRRDNCNHLNKTLRDVQKRSREGSHPTCIIKSFIRPNIDHLDSHISVRCEKLLSKTTGCLPT